MRPDTIGLIGGLGRMGQWLQRLFSEGGYPVLVADPKGGRDNREVAKRCDVVVLSVPIRALEGVIREVGPQMRKGSLLMDVTSLKEAPVVWMLKHSKAEVIGTHPLFGPHEVSLEGQILFTCMARGDRWRGWFHSFFSGKGLRLVEIDPMAHDHLMAHVQSLRHLLLIGLGHALMRLGFDLKGNLGHCGPWFHQLIEILKRQLRQPPDLYTDLVLNNPKVPEVFRAFRDTIDAMDEAIRSGDREALLSWMRQTASYVEDADPFVGRSDPSNNP